MTKFFKLIGLYDIRIPAKVKPLKKFDELHFVTEYFGPTLHDRMAEKKRAGKVWTHQELSYCVMQLLCGVKYLHGSGIVHRVILKILAIYVHFWSKRT